MMLWKSFCVSSVRAVRGVGGVLKSRCYGAGLIEVPLTADHYQVKRGDFASVSKSIPPPPLPQALKTFFR